MSYLSISMTVCAVVISIASEGILLHCRGLAEQFRSNSNLPSAQKSMVGNDVVAGIDEQLALSYRDHNDFHEAAKWTLVSLYL
jgi:hypothetical protein